MENKKKIFVSLGLTGLMAAFLVMYLGRSLVENTQPIKKAYNSKAVLGAFVNARGFEPAGPPGPLFDFKINQKELENVKAKSYIVFDLESGAVLVEKNSEEKLPVASLTKLMTAYVIYENLDLDEAVLVTPKNFWQVSPKINLKTNDQIMVQSLFDTMLVGSANDSAFALADFYERSLNRDFVEEMNLYAKKLNMSNSSFSNPVGFDSVKNYSTAGDLKILVSEVFKLTPFRSLARKDSYSFVSLLGNKYTIKATNKLVKKYEDIFAIKTGYTTGALGAMATAVERDGRQIGILVLDSPQREKDTLLIRNALSHKKETKS